MKRLEELLHTFQPSIEKITSISGSPNALYEPISYILGLGGKRIRPAMVLASFKLYKDTISKDVQIYDSPTLDIGFIISHYCTTTF